MGPLAPVSACALLNVTSVAPSAVAPKNAEETNWLMNAPGQLQTPAHSTGVAGSGNINRPVNLPKANVMSVPRLVPAGHERSGGYLTEGQRYLVQTAPYAVTSKTLIFPNLPTAVTPWQPHPCPVWRAQANEPTSEGYETRLELIARVGRTSPSQAHSRCAPRRCKDRGRSAICVRCQCLACAYHRAETEHSARRRCRSVQG